MKIKLTAKQELFARELAKGTNQYQAYCKAYPLQAKNSKRETLDVHAHQMSNNERVIARVAHLQHKALESVKYDIEAHFQELKKAQELALLPKGQHGDQDTPSFIKATELKGKVKGLYTQKIEATVTTEMSKVLDELEDGEKD